MLHESDSISKHVTTETIKQEEIENKDQLYHFVMTDEQRIKRFCTALLFHVL